jgi:tetratricopeptide (TPR) repeat protein/predicted Ser/Thr protein kinase
MPVPDPQTFDGWFDAPKSPVLGRQLGPFRLIRELAQGGMGVVYEAEQEEPRRKIALKVLRLGLATEAARSRFEREARILGNLSHPGIAALHGAGAHAAESGERVPYLVMELVRGARSITEFVRQRELSTEARLRLFLDAAAAIAAGHQRGIIHRDLKPDNVLVDEAGRTKVIDFGIARIIAPDLERGPATETGLIMGTLGYIAPEQLSQESAGDDVRMDVYALGVILYEMLTGHAPLDLKGLDAMQAVRVILEHRPTPPTQYAPGLSQDLALILGKALSKDPDRRYGSVDALSSDIDAFLASEPIRARPPSLTYQLRLFTRRHRVGVLATAFVAVALVGATWFSIRAAHREARQRLAAEEAERAADEASKRAYGLLLGSQELVRGLSVDHYKRLASVPGTLPARVALVEQLEEGTRSLRLHAQDDERFLRIAGLVHLNVGMLNYRDGGDHLGRPQAAREAFARAREAFELLTARDDVEADKRLSDRMHIAVARGFESDAYAFEGHSAEALEGARASEALLAGLLESHANSIPLRNNLATCRTRLARLAHAAGDVEGALTYLEHAVVVLPAERPADETDAEVAYGNRGFAEALWGEILRGEGRMDEARTHLEASLAAFETGAEISPDDPSRLAKLGQAHGELGMLALKMDDKARARQHLQRALDLGRERRAHNPQDRRALQALSVDLTRMADLHRAEGDLKQAAALHRESAAISKRLAAEQPDALFSQLEYRIALNRLGGILLQQGNAAESAGAFQQAYDLAKRLVEKHPQNIRARVGWGEALDALGIARWSTAQGKPKAVRRELLTEAKGLFEASVDVHAALEKEGLLPATHKGAVAQIANKVGICEQNLKALE